MSMGSRNVVGGTKSPGARKLERTVAEANEEAALQDPLQLSTKTGRDKRYGDESGTVEIGRSGRFFLYELIGGWGCETNREIGFVSFVRACERSCAWARGDDSPPAGSGFGKMTSGRVGARLGRGLFPCQKLTFPDQTVG